MSKKKETKEATVTPQDVPKGWLTIAICPADAAVLLRCIRYGRAAVSTAELTEGTGKVFQARCDVISAGVQEELLIALLQGYE